MACAPALTTSTRRPARRSTAAMRRCIAGSSSRSSTRGLRFRTESMRARVYPSDGGPPGRLPLPVAAIALARLGLGLRVPLAVLGEGAADVDHLREASVRVATRIALIALVRFDELAFTRHDF